MIVAQHNKVPRYITGTIYTVVLPCAFDLIILILIIVVVAVVVVIYFYFYFCYNYSILL